MPKNCFHCFFLISFQYLLLEQNSNRKKCHNISVNDQIIVLFYKSISNATMTNVTLSRMFRGKVRSNTCRIIILTSIVWLLIDVVVLMRYVNVFSSSNDTGRRQGEYEVEVFSFIHSINQCI